MDQIDPSASVHPHFRATKLLNLADQKYIPLPPQNFGQLITSPEFSTDLVDNAGKRRAGLFTNCTCERLLLHDRCWFSDPKLNLLKRLCTKNIPIRGRSMKRNVFGSGYSLPQIDPNSKSKRLRRRSGVRMWRRGTLPKTPYVVLSFPTRRRMVFEEVWDLGGQERLRTSWATYYRGTHAVIAVIDSTDRARISIMKDELFRLLGHDDLQQSVVLVFANKQDLKDAMTPVEITDALSLHSIKNHDWHIQACSALTGDGLYDGLGWIAQQVTGKTPS
ncbi:ADP-ribosylation factor-like protein 5, partial [Cucurbita argyrosperma subsp. argyrosperma]